MISVIGMTVDQLAPSQVFGRSLISLSSIICLIAGTMALISAIRGRILCWEYAAAVAIALFVTFANALLKPWIA